MNVERLKEIMKMAYKLNWTTPNPSGHPLMQLSEVEKCMLALYDDYQLERMRRWYNDELRKDAIQEGEQ